jgi:hypothetical protein
MRLPLIAETEPSSEQRPLYADMRAGIERSFEGFTSIAKNGALMGRSRLGRKRNHCPFGIRNNGISSRWVVIRD